MAHGTLLIQRENREREPSRKVSFGVGLATVWRWTQADADLSQAIARAREADPLSAEATAEVSGAPIKRGGRALNPQRAAVDAGLSAAIARARGVFL
jgi:hypothetical protein